MRELRIEEQKSILGGKRYYFTDKTTGYGYVFDSKIQAKREWNKLDGQGHFLTDILYR